MKPFFFSIVEDLNRISNGIQVIIGMTLGNEKLKEKIKEYNNVNIILLEDKAIKPID